MIRRNATIRLYNHEALNGSWAKRAPLCGGERCINRLKQWRGLATRYEKTATVYLAGLHIAGIFLWSAR
ncbi:hypothetical protein [Streptomyces sp. SAS_281]|uniref:hypothetical protein n=1 Tax=Streptomyces sp. SAS_281 TaxID=3412744 RepID=UPI00403D3EDE